MMVGRDLQDIYPKKHAKIGNVVLDVKNLSRPKVLHNISLQVRAGEIVGLAGMRGAGRTELLRAIFGADPCEGSMILDGKPFNPGSPKDAIDQKVALVTEDRKAEGLLLQQSVKFNTTISGLKEFCTSGVINNKKEIDHVQQMVKKLRVKTPGINNLVVGMSGGNQQKVIIARFLGARVLLLDEPTRGIDVGSKNEIYQVMVELAEQGLAVLMVSSELPEVLGMSDRVLVMHEGHIAKELSRAEANEESIMKYATGSHLES
jgi:inositol transport system ATP-binding protein